MADRSTPVVIARGASGYPPRLLDLPDPPERLHVRGRVPTATCVAIVGSRAASAYGLARATELAGDLAAAGLVVVSGLARGIDTAAHRAALAAGAVTMAVLPGGLDPVTPPANAALADEIARGGALVSEWPDGTNVRPGRFLERNRLIAALAAVVVVVEAAERSGALSTAYAALRLARPCLAVPGDVDRPTSRGCHALLRRGARVCENLADILEHLPEVAGAAATARAEEHGSATATAMAPPATVAGALLALLERGPADVEALAARAGVDVSEALAALLVLEWSGAVVSLPGQRWSRGTRGR